jgi:hypothetical protein
MIFKFILIYFITMILSTEKIFELIKKPKNAAILKEAVIEEKTLKAYATGENKHLIIDECLKMLVPERQPKFKESFGLHTKPLIDKVATHFQRIFDATGRVIDNKFFDSEQKQDFENYVSKCYESASKNKNGLSSEYYYKHIGLESILFEPNNIALIDFSITKNDQGAYDKIDKRNEPFVSTVNIKQIWDIDSSARGIEYLIIYNEYLKNTQKTKQFFVVDDLNYTLFELNKSGNPQLILQNRHNFECVPATHISSYNKYKGNYTIKKSPISDSLDDLYAWILLKNFSKMYGWESGVPTQLQPKFKCDNTHHTGVHCNNGIFKLNDGQSAYCEKCQRKSQEKTAWGKVVEIPMEYLETESAERFMKLFSYVDFNTDVMRFHEEDLSKKEEKIISDIIGKSQNSVSKSKEARNEIDVQSDTEDMRRVLASVSEMIEQTWQFTDSLIAKARNYNSYVSSSIFLGRGYMLQSKEKYYNEYDLLRKAGADDFLLNKKLSEIIETEYGYDKNFVDVFGMVAGIVPFRNIPTEKIYEHFDKFKTNEDTELDLYVRLYSATWIQELIETNDMNVWGKDLLQEQKFNILKDYFYAKASEIKTKNIVINQQNG